MKVIMFPQRDNPEIVVAMAAKLTHEPDERGLDYMMEKCSDPKHRQKIIESCLDSKHESVLEHASFTFYVEDVSRALTHQLVRHRLASYSQQSQRYVKMKEPTYVIPETFNGNQRVMFIKSMNKSWEEYERLIESGAKPEDARFVLPNACTSKIMITMNARELRHFFKLRIHPHAQWEIQEMASRMFVAAYNSAHLLFKDMFKDPYLTSKTEPYFQYESSKKNCDICEYGSTDWSKVPRDSCPCNNDPCHFKKKDDFQWG